jgi:hypothetical protein
LTDVVKALRSANFSKILVTADHGFLFQRNALEAYEFASPAIEGEEIYLRSRRALVGKGIQKSNSFKSFSAKQVGLQGDYEVLIPKSIHRLRLQGAGSRFVHGGASLQEIVIPVVQVEVQRGAENEAQPVSVDRIKPSTNMITTGLLAFTLYQEEPVSEKVRKRTLVVGLYAAGDRLISDEKTLVFNSPSEHAEDRATEVTLRLGPEADEHNNETVFLKLKEQEPNSNHYREIDSWEYRLNKAQFAFF